MSWEVCSQIYRLGIFYSNDYNGNNTKLITKIEQGTSFLRDCFFYSKAQEQLDKYFNNETSTNNRAEKIQLLFGNTKYSKDVNMKVYAKIFQYLSPSNFIRSLADSQYYSTFPYYLF